MGGQITWEGMGGEVTWEGMGGQVTWEGIGQVTCTVKGTSKVSDQVNRVGMVCNWLVSWARGKERWFPGQLAWAAG